MKPLRNTCLSILAMAAAVSAHGQSAYTSGHGDIGLAYEGGAFEPHWHIGGGATVDGSPLAFEEEYEPDDLYAQTEATRFSPTGLSAGLGVADGTEIFVLGSSTYQPNLGFAVEELDFSDWVGDITLTLTDWTLPTDGELAIYTTNLSGSTVSDIAFSTYDSGATVFGNSIALTPGDHVHFQWGLTVAGQYDLEFTWSGTHVTDGFQTASQVFSVNAVPEPASFALIFGVVVAGVASRRRRFAK